MTKDWKEITIADLGQVITGNTPPKKDSANYGGAYPFIKPTDMDIDKRYVTKWEENYSEKAFKRYKNAYIPPKATGVVTIGTVGEKMFQADQYCFTNQSVNVVIPSKDYDEDFVFYLLKYNLPKVENANPGTASGRHHVSKSNFCAIKLNVPSLDRQRKISTILSAYDDLIENNLKRIKLLEEKAQRTYEEWFVKMRFPSFENVVFDSIKGIPVGWEKVKLNHIIEYKVDNRGRNPSYYCENGIPVLDNHLINNSAYVDLKNAKRYLSDELYEGFIRKYLKENDVLITLVGTVGNIALAPKLKCAIIQNTIGLRCNNLCNQYFLFLFLKLNKKTILNYNRGSAQPSVKVGDLLSINVELPDKITLSLFEEYCKPLFESIINIANQNQLLKEARDILLPRLMSGMIDVNELPIESLMTTKE